jgi:ABC-type transport system substrate-binding protein
MCISDYMINKASVYEALRYTAIVGAGFVSLIGVSEALYRLSERKNLEVAKAILRKEGYTAADSISAGAGRRLIIDCENKSMKAEIREMPVMAGWGKKESLYGVRCGAGGTVSPIGK